MKKYLITSSIVFLAFASVAMAQNYTFNTNLYIGSSGDDVTNLQTWLINNGFDIPSVSSNYVAKGYFGSQTQSALMRYQRSIGLPAFGFFGPMTRQYLRDHDNNNGGGNNGGTQDSSFQVTSPNGGETWILGTTQTITWNGSPDILTKTGSIKLAFPTPACALPGQPIRCMIAVRAPLTIAQNVNLNTRSYSWNVGWVGNQNGNGGTGDLEYAPNGQYQIQICTTDGSQCDSSDSTFTITSTSIPPPTGNTPVISGVDAPTTLNVGQTGTWTVHATDPLNGTLNYSVNWGDVSNCNYPYTCVTANAVASFVQGTTFTHSYSTTGIYTITFTVRNSSGQQAQVTSTVNVTSSTGAGPLQIISPNGGETWLRGTNHNITWTSPYYLVATTVDLKLMHQFVCTTQACPAIAYAPYTIVTGLQINQNSYNWNVGTVLSSNTIVCMPGESCYQSPVPDGQYTVQICQSKTSNCDSSDALFTIAQ